MAVFKQQVAANKSLSAETALRLIADSHDVLLVVNAKGVIVDVALGPDTTDLDVVQEWLNKRWVDTTTVGSHTKIEDLLDPQAVNNGRWRQVNHATGDTTDLPITYRSVQIDEDGTVLAVGRDLRHLSDMQQRLMDMQHTLETDYSRMHRAEVRYQMLFSMSSEAMLFVDADSKKIVDANDATGRLLETPISSLINRAFPRGFSDVSNDRIAEMLTKTRGAGGTETLRVTLANKSDTAHLTATLIRAEEGPQFLIRIARSENSDQDLDSHQLSEVVQKLPDAFVMTNQDGHIIQVNNAFLDLVSIASDKQAESQPLGRWLGRSGIDVKLLLRHLRERGQVRSFQTIVQPEFGDRFDVDLSAVSTAELDAPCLGFLIRRRMKRTGKGASNDKMLLRSLQETTDLVGQLPLKDLVRETTDVIERLCIIKALAIAENSRAAAAEMLGLSRQSLYSKLRRYGIAEFGEDSD